MNALKIIGRAVVRIIRKEAAVITGVAAAVIATLTQFDVINWTDGQITTVMGLVAAVLLLMRVLVTPAPPTS